MRPTDEPAASSASAGLRPAVQPPGPNGGPDGRGGPGRPGGRGDAGGGPAPGGFARLLRRRLALLAAAVAVLLLAGGGLVVAYLGGAFADEGRFPSAAKPCSLVDRDLAATLVPEGVFTETGDLCAVDNFDAPDTSKLTLTSNATRSDGRLGAAEVASRYVGRVFTGVGQRESGLGDEAVSFQPNGSRTIILVMRVSNALVTITGSNPASAAQSPADTIRAIARAAATRLTPR